MNYRTNKTIHQGSIILSQRGHQNCLFRIQGMPLLTQKVKIQRISLMKAVFSNKAQDLEKDKRVILQFLSRIL